MSSPQSDAVKSVTTKLLEGLEIPALSASFKRCFSRQLVTPEDGRRYSQTSFGLVVAAIISILASWLAGCVAHYDDVKGVIPAISNHSPLLLLLSLLFFIACAVPPILFHLLGGLYYHTATLCNSCAFALLAGTVALLVCCTDGLGSSIFGATLLSMLGISLIVPQEKALRLILFLYIVLISGIVVSIVWFEFHDSKKARHDLAVYLLALIATFSAWLIRIFLNALTGKPFGP